MSDTKVIQKLTEIIRMMRSGRADVELGDAMHEVTETACSTGKKCSLIVKIHVEPVADTDGERLVISDEHEMKLPKDPPKASFLYRRVDDAGQITHIDPQLDLMDALRGSGNGPEERAPVAEPIEKPPVADD